MEEPIGIGTKANGLFNNLNSLLNNLTVSMNCSEISAALHLSSEGFGLRSLLDHSVVGILITVNLDVYHTDFAALAKEGAC